MKELETFFSDSGDLSYFQENDMMRFVTSEGKFDKNG